MNETLKNAFANALVAGLKRRAIKTCAQWSQEYRIMGKPFPGKWTFKYHPWAKAMHDCDSELMVGQKAAQMAFTETALNKTFFAIDVLGESVLYILPASTPDANDFSTARFDPALEMSAHLQNLFTDVKNIGHKRAGNANLYIRGSRSRSQMKSVPAAVVIADEVDEMDQDNLVLAFERTSGQMNKQVFLLSTPTFDNIGINRYFMDSTQEHFFFKCPCCSRLTELVFPDCLVIAGEDPSDTKILESHLICKDCKGKLEHETKYQWLKEGIWIPTLTNKVARGFHINQLYSSATKPSDIAKTVLRAQYNPADEQELYNSKMGLPHAVAGAKITDQNLIECLGDHVKQETNSLGSFTTMGIDVGKWLHWEVDEWTLNTNITNADINTNSKCRLIMEGKCLHFEELDNLLLKYRIRFCVIDANPERRKALELCKRFGGMIKMCFYARGINSKQIHCHDDEQFSVSVDRTSWMDTSLSRFKARTISLPKNLSLEYKNHVKTPIRHYEKDQDGNPVGRYITGDGKEDHFAHARTYSEIALALGAALSNPRDITT
jgi:hypothetical protein